MKPPRDLPEWLLRVLAHQQDLSQQEQEQLTLLAVRHGVQQSLQHGVTALGDVSRFCHLTRPLLKCGPLKTVSFGEVLGIGQRRHLVADRLRIAAFTEDQSKFLTVALSPHAPYSIEGPGVRLVAERARQDGMPVCMHLAESLEEVSFLLTGGGRFKEMLTDMGVWDERIEIPRTSPVRWAEALGLLGPRCLLAHGNYIAEEDMEALCASGTSVSYCPRTHNYFKHQPYPLLGFLGAGVNVCVGTDSLGSSPSLSVLAELIRVREQFPELSAETILALGTINAARALGLARHIGSLEVGKKADLVVYSCPDDFGAQPAEALLTGRCELSRVYIDGQRIS